MDTEQLLRSPDSGAGPAGTALRPTEALEGGIVAPPAELDESAATGAAVERLAIRIGSLNLLCAPEAGREVLLPPPVSHLPHTPEWLLGIANVRGALVPVVDLAVAFGLEHTNERRAYLLISGTGDNAMGLLVDGLPVLQRIDLSRRLDSIPPHPEMLGGHVLGAADHAGVIWLEVALGGLFQTLAGRIASAA